MDRLFVFQLVAAPILLVVALAVRFAGTSPILNVVDYSSVGDITGLHRWAGNRLLVLPVVSLVLGIVSLKFPALALPSVFIFVAAVFGVCIWLASGASKFNGR